MLACHGGRTKSSNEGTRSRSRKRGSRLILWEEKISVYLIAHSDEAKANNVTAKVTLGQIAHEVLHFQTSKIGTADARRIAAVMVRLRWHRELPPGKSDLRGKRWWVENMEAEVAP